MVAFAEHREVRVTARQSVTMPFVAPELSPTRLVDRELEKGLKGWTDFDVKCPDLRGDHKPAGLEDRQLEEMNVGTFVRKARGTARPIKTRYNTGGPSAGRKALMARKGF
ncbi:hypothetical protein SEA_ACOLYTE_91 [Mycobacterium phage Acolyte]|nr:hypothetical protein SEA_ACOLYTE_91 [Mycobacterium phage Acolyte]